MNDGPAQVLRGARVLGLERVELRVLDFTHPAIACYRRCGFVEVGRAPVRLGEVSAEDVRMVGAAPRPTDAV
jgi:RimJ/RimL family protein N-acetyltransferase